MDERERLAAAEEALRQVNARLDRQIPHVRADVADLRDDVERSRTECSSGLEGVRKELHDGFGELRASARAWISTGLVAVSAIVGIAAFVVSVVIR